MAAPAECSYHAAVLTANLTQGVCHEKEGCLLMPVPGAPSYALSNLEHAVVDGLTPAWFRDVQDAFYYGGLTGGWLVILVTIWLVWQCMQIHRRPTRYIKLGSNKVVPLDPYLCEYI